VTGGEPVVLNVHQAKTHLSRLLARVEAGDRITISRNGWPVADLVPCSTEGREPVAPVRAVVREAVTLVLGELAEADRRLALVREAVAAAEAQQLTPEGAFHAIRTLLADQGPLTADDIAGAARAAAAHGPPPLRKDAATRCRPQ
jgi:prevent-host-death family protein